MDRCEDSDHITVRARMTDRGRVTIKEDDRIALGINDLPDGQQALLEMDVRLITTVEDDGDE